MSAEPTAIDLLPPTSSDVIKRRLQRAAVLVTQAATSGAQTLPLLRSAKSHLVGTIERLDELIARAEVRAEDASVPATVDEQLTAARNDRIVK